MCAFWSKEELGHKKELPLRCEVTDTQQSSHDTDQPWMAAAWEMDTMVFYLLYLSQAHRPDLRSEIGQPKAKTGLILGATFVKVSSFALEVTLALHSKATLHADFQAQPRATDLMGPNADRCVAGGMNSSFNSPHGTS